LDEILKANMQKVIFTLFIGLCIYQVRHFLKALSKIGTEPYDAHSVTDERIATQPGCHEKHLLVLKLFT